MSQAPSNLPFPEVQFLSFPHLPTFKACAFSYLPSPVGWDHCLFFGDRHFHSLILLELMAMAFLLAVCGFLKAAALKMGWSWHELLEREIIFYHAHLFLFEGRPLIVMLEGWQSDSFPAGTSLVPWWSPAASTPNPWGLVEWEHYLKCQ